MAQDGIKSKQVCPRCAYPLADLPDEGVCPECGRAYDPDLIRRAALYRNKIKWVWRFGIGWPLFILAGLLVTGAFRPVSGTSFLDRYGHVAIVLGGMVGMILPIFVVMVRHARVVLKHGEEHGRIMLASDVGGIVGMLLTVWAFRLSYQKIESINVYLFLAVIPALNCVLALIGSIIGERIGIRLTQPTK